ncbi:MAG: hypothetical protein E6H84_12180 [Chloroflexi bacterium]|nr:MAG: hypothetical protein E6H84_12180 [Chloroflexota bacterium]
MTETFRASRTAALALLALALLAGAVAANAAVRVSPFTPPMGGTADPATNTNTTPAQMPNEIDSPAIAPAMVPDTMRAAPPATADGSANQTSTASDSTTPSTGTSSSDSAPGGGQGMAPSRWSEPVTGYPPGYVAPAQLAPTQLSPKIPRPGSSQ